MNLQNARCNNKDNNVVYFAFLTCFLIPGCIVWWRSICRPKHVAVKSKTIVLHWPFNVVLRILKSDWAHKYIRTYSVAFSTQVCGFKPGRSRRIFRTKKVVSTPSFGGEVKPSVPCRRFAACKRSLNLRGIRNLGKITTGHLSRPQFHLSLLGSLTSLRTEAPGGKSGNV